MKYRNDVNGFISTAIFIFIFFYFFHSNPNYTIVLLFRVSSPTKNQIERIKTYKKQLPSKYEVVILTDACNNNSNGIATCCVDRKVVIKKYPEVKRMGGICNNKSDTFYMWMLHSEHYLLWDDIYRLNYQYLWVFDQDVIYTGNIYNFFKKYDKFDEDLIIYNDVQYFIKGWHDCVTEEYRKSRSNESYYIATHVHRLSKKLRNALRREFELKRHAQVEQMILETALYYKLSIRKMDKRDYDKNRGFGKIINTKEELELLLKDNSTKNILYHPVRY